MIYYPDEVPPLILLRLRYAMSGTHIGYTAKLLRLCYAMPCTCVLSYGMVLSSDAFTLPCPVLRHALAMQCPVANGSWADPALKGTSPPILLRVCYAMSGTTIPKACRATPWPVVPEVMLCSYAFARY
eukprot:3186943-Rhodomonas_salina.1